MGCRMVQVTQDDATGRMWVAAGDEAMGEAKQDGATGNTGSGR
jgi:hypothetical protein